MPILHMACGAITHPPPPFSTSLTLCVPPVLPLQAARQIWGFVTLSLYLKSLTGTNFSVGLSEGIQGGLQAFTAIVVGWYVDKARRDTGMKIAGSLGLVAIGELAHFAWRGGDG
jgi:hypothetical protein